MQDLPLEAKIIKSQRRIREWYEYWNGEVYISFSGGKDSTVLLNLVREIYPEVPAVFIDTGLEYPEIKEFVKTIDNVITVRPKMSFVEVLKKYGYPVISKTQALAIRKLTKQNLTPKYRDKLLYGDEKGNAGKLSDKWHYLLNAPFDISDQCCGVMKKSPIRNYEKETKKHAFIGMMASESKYRELSYLKTGCNAFNLKKPQSQPMAFWTEQDVLRYIKNFDISYASVYGDIVNDENDELKTTGERRTGCCYCMFGVHLEKGENRFQRMKRIHPKIHDYCINKLGMGEVLDYIGVKYV